MVQSGRRTSLMSERKVAQDPGALTAGAGPRHSHISLGSPRAGSRGGEMSAYGERTQERWARAPAHHHQLLFCCIPAEALPHVNGEQGAAAVEDGGE